MGFLRDLGWVAMLSGVTAFSLDNLIMVCLVKIFREAPVYVLLDDDKFDEAIGPLYLCIFFFSWVPITLGLVFRRFVKV